MSSEGTDRSSVVPAPVEHSDDLRPPPAEQQVAGEGPSLDSEPERAHRPRRAAFLRPRVGLIVALVGLCALLTCEVVFIAKGTAPIQGRGLPKAVTPDADAGAAADV